MEARREEREARARWFHSLNIAEDRLTPDSVGEAAISYVKASATEAAEHVSDTVRNNPGKVAAAGAAVGLFLFRKPIIGAVRRIFSRSEATSDTVQPLAERDIQGVDPVGAAPKIWKITEEV